MASAPLKTVMKVANGLRVALYRMSGGKFANKIANIGLGDLGLWSGIFTFTVSG